MSIDPTSLASSGFIPLSASSGSGGSGSSPATGGPQAASGSSMVSETSFLQMLVAELQNQNPLQPMNNTQFVAQLAQFQTLNVMQYILSDLDQLVTRAGGTPADASSSPGGSASPGTGGSAPAGSGG